MQVLDLDLVENQLRIDAGGTPPPAPKVPHLCSAERDPYTACSPYRRNKKIIKNFLQV